MFRIYYTIFIILIEMFDLFETEFIRSLAILVYLNNLIGRKEIITISIFKIILTCYNNKQKHRSTIRIDILNHNDPFLIARLYSFNFPTPVVQYYNKDGYNLAYKKTYLVEIPDIGLYNTIFNNHILEKSKLNPNNLQIFVLSPLVIVQTIPTYTELWLSFNKVRSSTQSDIRRVVYRQQSVGYIFYIVYPGKKSSRI